jgi:hypothetical protein
MGPALALEGAVGAARRCRFVALDGPIHDASRRPLPLGAGTVIAADGWPLRRLAATTPKRAEKAWLPRGSAW